MIGSNWWLAYSTRHIIPHTYNQLTVGKRNCTTRCWDFTQRWAHALFFFFALSLFALFRRTIRDSCHRKSAMARKTARGPTSDFMYFIPGIGKKNHLLSPRGWPITELVLSINQSQDKINQLTNHRTRLVHWPITELDQLKLTNPWCRNIPADERVEGLRHQADLPQCVPLPHPLHTSQGGSVIIIQSEWSRNLYSTNDRTCMKSNSRSLSTTVVLLLQIYGCIHT